MSTPAQPFVLLYHTLSAKEHWDLCLDIGPTLATWQIAADPTGKADNKTHSYPARRIANHRRAYLEHEGPIPGGRGEVRRVERGTWRLVGQESDTWVVDLQGTVLRGIYRLPAGPEPGEMSPVDPKSISRSDPDDRSA
ncbi:MAG TPA: DNA polymerase ligase N-terminal domain-containing protein [Phycisphaerae bacterium]|nr:DNA polymerase ligase N-terminal domain-containing protein [Phycisphaerae bacterium]